MTLLTAHQLNAIREICSDTTQYDQIVAVLTDHIEPNVDSLGHEAFYQVFRNSPDAMIISSLETGCYIDVNDSFVKSTGYERHELIGRSSVELSVWTNPVDRERFVELLTRDGFVINFEAPYRKKDGSIGVGLVSSQFITLNNERSLVSVTRDITMYKGTLRSLTRAEERSAVYQDVLTNAAHEFRTPLSIINSSVYLAKKHQDEVKRHNALNTIADQASLMAQLLDNFMFLARVETEKDFPREVVDPETLIDMVIHLHNLQALPNAPDIRITLTDNMPSLYINQQYLSFGLFQLLRNAIDYSPANTDIKIKATYVDTNFAIEIIDSGEGIDKDVLPHIFDRFYRGNSARTTRGLGLGLSIARKIADIHGCKIHVKTGKDVGSQFQLIFPQEILR